MQNVYVIGCGGIGCYILERLPMVISSLTLDLLPEDLQSEAYLNLGKKPLPPLVDRLVLIDGDRFNARNAVRQRAGAGDKVVQRMLMLRSQIDAYKRASANIQAAAGQLDRLEELLASPELAGLRDSVETLTERTKLSETLLKEMQNDMIRVAALPTMRIIGVRKFLTPGNMWAIIPRNPEHSDGSAWKRTERSRQEMGLPSLLSTVVFLCVDNKKTRYEVQKYAEQFDDMLVINGGNDKTTGQVNVYERRRGVSLDPTLYDIYPDINPNADKRPDEVECGAVAPQHDQIAITNSMVANLMLSWYVKWAKQGLDVEVKGQRKRYNEILLDIEKPSVLPLYHPLS